MRQRPTRRGGRHTAPQPFENEPTPVLADRQGPSRAESPAGQEPEPPDGDARPAHGVLDGWAELRQIAAEIDRSPRTLARWHQSRTGPPRVKVGNRVLYRRESVRSWLASLEKSSRPRRQ